MNKGLTGWEQHEGEQLMTEFSFLGEPPRNKLFATNWWLAEPNK